MPAVNRFAALRRMAPLGAKVVQWTERLRRSLRGNLAWMLAAVTGTCGVLLLFLLLFSSPRSAGPPELRGDDAAYDEPVLGEATDDPFAVPSGPMPADSPSAASADEFIEFQQEPVASVEPAMVEPDPFMIPPAREGDPFSVESEPFGGEPDPFGEMPARPTEPAAEPPLLEVELTHEPLPGEPGEMEEEERFVVESAAVLEPLPADAAGDDWRRFEPLRDPVEPASYLERLSAEMLERLLADHAANGETNIETAGAGPRELSVTITRTAPPEAGVRQRLQYELLVRNEGETEVERIEVEERVPEAHRVLDVSPAALQEDRTLRWRLGPLRPGGTERLLIELLPTETGRAESVAAVRPFAAVGGETLVEAPKLQLELRLPEQVRLGHPLPVRFRVTNVGPVEAGDVKIQHDLPDELSHKTGRELGYDVGTLAPGESREVRLTVQTERPGRVAFRAEAVAVGGISEAAGREVEIFEPSFSVRRTGYRRLGIGQSATYTNHITNSGSQTLEGVTVVETIPAGLEVVQVLHGGSHDPQTGTVSWRIGKFHPGQTVDRAVVVRSRHEGRYRAALVAQGDDGPPEPFEAQVEVIVSPRLAARQTWATWSVW